MKSNDGVVLIELLVSIVVIGVILLLMTNLLVMVSSVSKYDQITTKYMQVSSLIYEDILAAKDVSLNNQCLQITTDKGLIEFCIADNKLIRSVDGKGFERLIADFDGSFKQDHIIYLEVTIDEQNKMLPLWSK